MSSTIRLLLVESDDSERRLIHSALRGHPTRFRIADVASLGDISSQFDGDRFDVALVDLDGWPRPFDGLERIRGLAPALPIAVLSSTDVAVEAVRRGADGFVMKTEQDLAMLHVALPAVRERAAERARSQALLSQLQASDQRYRLLFDNVQDALLLCDDSGKLLQLNRSAEQLLGRSASELVGTRLARLMPDRTQLSPAKLTASHPVRIVLSHPAIPVDVRASAFTLGDQPAYLVTMRDLRREERASQVLQALTRASAAMQGALTPLDVFRAAGEQLRSIGMTLSALRYLEDENALVMLHTEIASSVVKYAQRLVGFDPLTFHIPLGSSPILQSVLASPSPSILPHAVEVIREMLPRRFKQLAAPIQKVMGYEDQFGLRLSLADRLFGVILVGYSEGQLIEEDQPIIEAFAAQIQAALERSQRFEVTQTRLAAKLRQLTHLVQVGEQMQLRLPLAHLLDLACSAIRDSLGWEYVIIWLRDEPSSVLLPRATQGTPPEHRLPAGEFDAAILHNANYRVGRCYFVPDGDTGAHAWQPGDVLVVPLEVGGELLGAIQVDSPVSGQRPSLDDLAPLELFANQVAVAIENAGLYARTRAGLKQRTDELTALTTLSAVADQGDLGASLKQALYQVLQVSGMDAAIIALLDHATGELRPHVRHGVSDAFWQQMTHAPTRIGEGVGGRALAAGNAIVVTSVATDPRVPYRESLIQENVQTVVGVGLTGRSPVGSMTLYATAVHHLADETLDWLTVAGRQIALSIENTRLIESTRRRQQMAEAVREVNAAVASNLELDAVLETIFDQVKRVVQYDSSSIWLVESDVLRMIATRGAQAASTAVGAALARDEEDPNWQAVLSRAVQVAADIRSPAMSEGRAWIGAPLVVHNEVIGLLTLDHHQPGFYTDEDAHNVLLIAQQAAVAIDNAQRFEIERERSQRLRLLNDLGRELIVALDQDIILGMAAEYVARRFGYPHVDVLLIDAASSELVWTYYNGLRVDGDGDSKRRTRAGTGIIGHAATTGQTYVSANVDADAHYVRGLTNAQTRSVVAVPLRIEERVVGVLNIESDRLNAFSPDDVAILETLAGQIGAALAIAELYRETQARAGNLSMLFAASQELGSSLDSDQVFGRLTQWIVSAVETTSARVYIWDLPAHSGRLLAQYVGSRASASERQSMVGAEQDLTSLPALVETMQARRWMAYSASDTQAVLDVALADTLRSAGAASALYLPLIVRERLIGCVEIWETERSRVWHPDEVHLCQTIANVAASAIDNARLFEVERQRRAVAETVRELAAVVSSSLELQPILESLLDRAAELIPYDSAAVIIASPVGEGTPSVDDLRVAVSRGWPDFSGGEISRLPAGRLAGDVVRTQQVSICVDAQDEPDYDDRQAFDHVRGWLGAPLKVKGRVIGVLAFDSRTPGRYRREHAEIAETIANHAAVAIENAQLYQETAQRLAELETLQTASLELIQSLDVRRVSQAIANGALRLLKATAVHLFSFDVEADALHMVAVSAAAGFEEVGQPTPRREGLTMQVAHRGQVVVVNDMENDPEYAAMTRATAMQGVKAMIALPLRVRSRVLGVMNVLFHVPHVIVDNEVRILGLLADQAATALENARLFEEEQRRRVAADVLREMSAVLTSTLNLNELFEHLFDQLARVIPYTSTSVLLLEKMPFLRVIAGRGFDRPQHVIGQVIDASQSSLSGQVINERRPRIVDDVQQLTNWQMLPGLENVHGWMGAPLIARDEIIGTLSVDHSEANVYRQAQAELLGVIANQAAAAIANARLYEQALERERFASALGRTSLAIMSTLELNAVLEQICRESAEAFDVSSGFVWMVEGDAVVGFAGHGPAREAFVGTRARLDSPDTLGARVIRERRGEFINQIEQDARANDHLARGTGARSLLAVPMFEGDSPVGTLVIADTVRDDRFTADDIERAQVLASHAVIAIENARLFEAEQRRARQLALVNRVGVDVTSILDLDQLAQTVVEEILSTFGFYHVGLVLLEDDAMVWRAGAGGDVPGWTAAGLQRRVGEGIVGAAATTGEVVLVEDVRADSRFVSVPQISRTLSELALPLKSKGAVVGVLDVESDQVNGFTQEDTTVLTALAGQLGVAVENALLYEAQAQYAASLETRVAERTAEIRREQERTITILNSVADAVLVTDLNGAIVLTNPTADQLLGEDQLAEQPERLRTWLRTLSPDSGAPKFDLETRTLQAAVAYIWEEARRVGHVIVLRDITRLEEVDRLKTQFVTNVSHELRTPLTNIKLYLGLFQKGKPEKREQYLVTLQNEVNRLERLITDLLDLSRLERDRHKVAHHDINLEDVLNHVVTTLEPQAEAKQQVLHLNIHTSPLIVPADRNQMIQVFVNLTANAINYTPAGGHVLLEANTAEQDGRQWAVVSVRDDGIGIPIEDQARVFDRFYRGQAEHFDVRGTGLGLSIVREIVMQHSGEIKLDSEVGRGSIFTVWLPTN